MATIDIMKEAIHTNENPKHPIIHSELSSLFWEDLVLALNYFEKKLFVQYRSYF